MLHLSITISLRALVFVLLLGIVLGTGSDVARGAPSAANLTADSLLTFAAGGQNTAHDINVSNNQGGLRFYGCQSLTTTPDCAAIQFFGNGANVFGGQLFLDSGSTATGAIIFRTAPTGSVAERLRVTAGGSVGIGTNNPQDQLELTGNLRLPATTATTGMIKQGSAPLIHTFGDRNFFAGRNAGILTTTGAFNTGVGSGSLAANTSGDRNTGLGQGALENTAGDNNTAVGNIALSKNTTGSKNTAVGTFAGTTLNLANANATGSNNTYIGANAGPASSAQLTNATAIGYNAQVDANNALVLGGTGTDAVNVGIGTTTPLTGLTVLASGITTALHLGDTGCGATFAGITFASTIGTCSNYALRGNGTDTTLNRASGGNLDIRENNVTQLRIESGGQVGIGTSAPISKLEVKGGDIRVTNGSFIDDGTTLTVPDYVFEPGYALRSFDELRAFIAANLHLPNVPSSEEIRQDGLNVSQFQMRLLEKVEELTLYLLDQDERASALEQEIADLRATVAGQSAQTAALAEQNASLEARLAAIEQQMNGGTTPLVAAR